MVAAEDVAGEAPEPVAEGLVVIPEDCRLGGDTGSLVPDLKADHFLGRVARLLGAERNPTTEPASSTTRATNDPILPNMAPGVRPIGGRSN